MARSGFISRIRFHPAPDGGTRLDVRISYQRPAGAVGHVIARLLGSDPKRAVADDLARLKSLLEQGKTSVRGETVTRDALSGVARTLVP